MIFVIPLISLAGKYFHKLHLGIFMYWTQFPCCISTSENILNCIDQETFPKFKDHYPSYKIQKTSACSTKYVSSEVIKIWYNEVNCRLVDSFFPY